MRSLIEAVVDRLNYLAPSQLQVVLNFVEFLSWQEEHQQQSNIDRTMLEISAQEFAARLDELSNEAVQSFEGNIPSLSDYAASRAGIYEEQL